MATIIPEPAPQEPADPADRPHGAKRERLKREDPKRSGPIRNATAYFRDSQSWDESAPDPAAPDRDADASLGEALDDVITHGVHLGYKVIEEHILKGQQAARRLRQSRPETPDDRSQLDGFVEQAQRLYQDLGTLCFDALETLARSPALLRSLARSITPETAPDPAAKAGPHADSVGPGARFGVQIASRHRTRVDLRLDPEVRLDTLKVHALHASGPGVPPLTAIAFRPEPNRGTALLDVTVPDRQPPGLYSGVVVDSETNEPAGLLTVRIAERSES